MDASKLSRCPPSSTLLSSCVHAMQFVLRPSPCKSQLLQVLQSMLPPNDTLAVIVNMSEAQVMHAHPVACQVSLLAQGLATTSSVGSIVQWAKTQNG